MLIGNVDGDIMIFIFCSVQKLLRKPATKELFSKIFWTSSRWPEKEQRNKGKPFYKMSLIIKVLKDMNCQLSS